jgi:hypothetical protein
MFSQTLRQAPPTRPVIFAGLSQRQGGLTVSASWRSGCGSILPEAASGKNSQAPPSYSQAGGIGARMAAPPAYD